MTKQVSTLPTKNVAKKPKAALKATPLTFSKVELELVEMLRYKRAQGSTTEKAFIEKYLKPLEDLPQVDKMRTDPYGNLHIYVPDTKKGLERKMLFSSHTDTVHSRGGEQTVILDQNTGIAYLDIKGAKGKQAYGHCLGADDGTGVWLMRHMILAKVPGLYIFHFGEEGGGIGSSLLAQNWQKDVLAAYPDHHPEIAIAFDRKGYSDVIDAQSGGTGASKMCTKALCELLNKEFNLSTDETWSPATGTFTDTANYFGLVDECFNLSVGYFKQHGPNETQDVKFAGRLLKALIKLDWGSLPKLRDSATFQARRNKFSSYQDYADACDVWGNDVKKSSVLNGANVLHDLPDEEDDITEDVLYDLAILPDCDLVDLYADDVPFSRIVEEVTRTPALALELLRQTCVTDLDMYQALLRIGQYKDAQQLARCIRARAVEEDYQSKKA